MGSFLQSRKFFRLIAVYLGSSWVLIEATSYFLERFDYPHYWVDILMVLLGFGLISFIVYEWKESSGTGTRKKSFYMGIHGAVVVSALIAAYIFYQQALLTEIRHQGIKQEKISIAVLPFANVSPENQNDWLSDGLCDQIIDQLNYIESVDVKSRSASFYFKNKDYNPVQIANLLNVDNLLEGSVMLIDSVLRISVKLINPLTGSQLWSQTFDRSFENILDLQSEIAMTVAEKINADISENAQEKISNQLTENEKAYQAFLRGKYHYNLLTPTDNRRAHDYFQEAIRLDPKLAEAYAYLGLTYNMFGGYLLGLIPDSAYVVVKEMADKALAVDPNLGLGYFLQANYEYFYLRNYIKGLETADKAFKLANSKEEIIWLYGGMLSINKKSEVALKIINKYIESNPTSAEAYQALCLSRLIHDGKNTNVPKEEIISICEHAMELDPSLIYNKYYIAELLFGRGEYEAARKHYEELMQIAPFPHFVEGLFRTTYYSGDEEIAMQYFNQLELLSNQIMIPYVMTRAYSTLGDVQNALLSLEEAFDYKDIELVNLAFDWALDPIRDDPRFQEILSRLQYAGDQ